MASARSSSPTPTATASTWANEPRDGPRAEQPLADRSRGLPLGMGLRVIGGVVHAVGPVLEPWAEGEQEHAGAGAPKADGEEGVAVGGERFGRVEHLAADGFGGGELGDPAGQPLRGRGGEE